MVVDASTVVSSALKKDSIPRQALLLARNRHTILLSDPVFAEIAGVLARPKFAQAISADVRAEILGLLTVAASWWSTNLVVTDCRDAKDNKYLELAGSAGAEVIVSSDDDLLVLNPWRGVRIVGPREFLAVAS